MSKLKQLLKKLRPEELAVKLGVSVSSVFKWKSGEVKKPMRLAQVKIEELYAQEFAQK